MNIVAWVLSVLLALAMIGAGLGKLTVSHEKLLANPRMGWAEQFSGGQVKTIAALEVLAAIGLILPWLTGIAPVLTPLAAVGVVALMVGALIVHARRGELKDALPVNSMLALIGIVVAVLRFSQL